MEARRPTRRVVRFGAIAVLLIGAAVLIASRSWPEDAVVNPRPHHVRVVWTEDPQHRALVAWTTESEPGEHRVHWDIEARGGEVAKYAHTVDAGTNERMPGEYREVYYHHAQLEKLSPATTCYFVVTQGDSVSPEYHFTTAPDDDRSFSLLAGGDSRSDRSARQRVNRYLAELAADESVLALVHGGDYVYSGTSQKLWMLWLDDHELTVTESGRVLPIVPARGNHESEGPLYDVIFGTPGGGLGKNWFATRLSTDVLLVTLNSEVATGGRQRKFLSETLEANPSVRWQMANYHQPIWPAVKRPGSGRQNWMPAFEKYDLDLAIESDGHTLKRTVPIRGDRRDETGVVYIGEGGFGVKQRTPKRDRWYLQEPGFCDSTLHVWRLDIGRDALVGKALLTDGTVRDEFTLRPRSRPEAAKSPESAPNGKSSADGKRSSDG